MNRVKVLQERERMHSGKACDGPRHGVKSAKGPGERGKKRLHSTVIIKEIGVLLKS